MKWIKVEDQLPRDRQAVLVRRNEAPRRGTVV